jgi:C-terminal processing protease CtpA/Prc
MSENSGKRAALGISAAIVIILLAAGTFWFKARRPVPVIKQPLTAAGVGLYLGRNQDTHKFEVRRVFPNSPAEKAGLVPGQVLNKVNNVFAETKSIKELSALLMGPVGSKVTVEIIDTNTGAASQVELVREHFPNRSTRSQPNP